ncbi:hypothetical protein DAMA08_014130 [Martiniozyma asiatica (nom. inval.)]|nr:hypothetical protein DAMA08_014130 [Martiniozyma asiatica]
MPLTEMGNYLGLSIDKKESVLETDEIDKRLKLDKTCKTPVVEDQKPGYEYEYKYAYTYNATLKHMSNQDSGLACLPIQKRLQVEREGCEFTIMCVGQSGVGKTSFMDSLFGSLLFEKPIAKDRVCPLKTTEIIHKTVMLRENNFTLKLNVIDTPGFGDFINNSHCCYPIINYINGQFERLLYQEMQPDRSKMKRDVVHICLYFFLPSKNGLSGLDIEAMRSLSDKVNLIPVISKADAYTKEEINNLKLKIRELLAKENISLCTGMRSGSTGNLIKTVPFAIVNSLEMHENEKGEKVKGRKYKWGLSEVENPNHSDFIQLKKLLVDDHMADFIASSDSYYESFREKFLNFKLDQFEFENQRQAKGKESGGTVLAVADSAVAGVGSIEASLKMLRMAMGNLTDANTNKSIDPDFAAQEKEIKAEFAQIVHIQNQKFKERKRALFDKQEQFNLSIAKLQRRLENMQQEILP